jgi:hypothetical protein
MQQGCEYDPTPAKSPRQSPTTRAKIQPPTHVPTLSPQRASYYSEGFSLYWFTGQKRPLSAGLLSKAPHSPIAHLHKCGLQHRSFKIHQMRQHGRRNQATHHCSNYCAGVVHSAPSQPPLLPFFPFFPFFRCKSLLFSGPF